MNGRSFLVRPYRRGGLPGRVIKDSFIYLRERNVRGIRELKLLCYLHGCGLPVPRPILTVFRRKQLTYRCSIILDYIPDVRPLASVFEDLAEERWYELGVLLKRLHCHQVYHTDLNSFNILVGSSQFHIIDFDKCYIVPPILRRWSAWWLRRNIHRLYRSLAKVDPEAGAPPKDAWKALLRGYDSV